VREFGLTGGIGSGKSAVSERLVAHGAGLVDADATVKKLQAAGMPVFDEIVSHFGDSVVGGDGELDRAALASIVFSDTEELQRLNEIVHPPVREDMARQRADLGKTHEIVVLDIPLLVEGDPMALAGIVVVDTPIEIAILRLVEHRGFRREDAEARMANQVSREERREKADFVIDNSGSFAHLQAAVDACWDWMSRDESAIS